MVQSATVPRSKIAEILSQKHIPSLDGLRAVSVILVICNHMGVPFAPHGRGVLTFFVLSGFLITWLMLKESERYSGISIRNFYVRRVLRIFPAFYVYLGLTLLVLALLQHMPSRWELLGYVCSVFYVGNYFFALYHRHYDFIHHTWALSIEEQFYLLWPWIFARFQFDLKRLTRLLVGGIVLIDVYRIVLFFKFHTSDAWLTLTFDSRLDHLLVGCLLAVLLKRGVLSQFWELMTSRLWPSLVTFALIIGSIGLGFHYGTSYKYAVGFVADPLLTAVLLIQVMVHSRSWMWGWLNWRVVRYLGQISYGMFLYHIFAYRMFVSIFGDSGVWIRVSATTLGAIVFGSVSFYVVERKFLSLKSRFLAPAKDMPRPRRESEGAQQDDSCPRKVNAEMTAHEV
jgi:peptidoglycan/LPS O-acetylase OafA/YrhL